jgi:hypothetical protein
MSRASPIAELQVQQLIALIGSDQVSPGAGSAGAAHSIQTHNESEAKQEQASMGKV